MSDRKYPDIQSIESKIQKVKEQILLYEDGYALHSVTKKRLTDVKSELEECLCILDRVLSSEQEEVAKPASQNVTKLPELDGDLSDLFVYDVAAIDKVPDDEKYKPKYIVATYRKRFEEVSQSSCGILQVNQFMNLISSWFEKRYSSGNNNSRFRYKADRIHEWIDLIIIAAGNAFANKMFVSFRSEFEEWIASINTDSDRNWILPKSIMKFQKSSAADYTEEAVLLERILKTSLYDDEFYPSLKDSVERIVMNSGRFGNTRLSVEQILEDCTGSWVVTSTFDKTLY